jgi:hypothetical protein
VSGTARDDPIQTLDTIVETRLLAWVTRKRLSVSFLLVRRLAETAWRFCEVDHTTCVVDPSDCSCATFVSRRTGAPKYHCQIGDVADAKDHARDCGYYRARLAVGRGAPQTATTMLES